MSTGSWLARARALWLGSAAWAPGPVGRRAWVWPWACIWDWSGPLEPLSWGMWPGLVSGLGSWLLPAPSPVGLGSWVVTPGWSGPRYDPQWFRRSLLSRTDLASR